MYGYQHSLFDQYSIFMKDQKARGNKTNLLARYARNCVYRFLNSYVTREDVFVWKNIFHEIELHRANTQYYTVLN